MLKTSILTCLACLSLASWSHALPNAVMGAVRQENSPLDGKDLTTQLFDSIGTDGANLPGRWAAEGLLADARISHLLARPKIFGEDVQLVRPSIAGKRWSRLNSPLSMRARISAISSCPTTPPRI